MEKRGLGKTGIEVSEISFGTVSLGVPYGIGIRGQEDMISEKDAVKLLQLALDKGINFFDCADAFITTSAIHFGRFCCISIAPEGHGAIAQL